MFKCSPCKTNKNKNKKNSNNINIPMFTIPIQGPNEARPADCHFPFDLQSCHMGELISYTLPYG